MTTIYIRHLVQFKRTN